MSSDTGVRRKAVVLHTDAVASTSRTNADEEAAYESIDACRALIRRLTEQHGGRVVDARADDLLLEFGEEHEATECAVEIQRSLAQRNKDCDAAHRLEYRIGVHGGEVLVHGDEISGIVVNTAARIGNFAAPGGLCLSESVYSTVEPEMDLKFEDLGVREIKGAPAVHIFRALVASMSPTTQSWRTSASEGEGPPAIAVLPFLNLSGDVAEEYFVDGVVEDLISELSTQTVFPVIARNSSFADKGKAVDIRRVSTELGARYIVEGSVRRSGERIRLTVQLIDASTGHHILSEQYNREEKDLFALQDELAAAVAGRIPPKLETSEMQRSARSKRPPLDAWEWAQLGWWYANQRNRDANKNAQTYFQKSIDLAPGSVWAKWGMLTCHFYSILYRWVQGEELLAARQQIIELGNDAAAIDVDGVDPLACLAQSLAHSFTGEGRAALEQAERAVELSPSFAFARYVLTMGLLMDKQLEHAVVHGEASIRLSPRDRTLFVFLCSLATAHFMAGRYEEAKQGYLESLRHRHGWSTAEALLIATYAHLGDLDRAQHYARLLPTAEPPFSLLGLKLSFPLLPEDYWARIESGLAAAGIVA